MMGALLLLGGCESSGPSEGASPEAVPGKVSPTPQLGDALEPVTVRASVEPERQQGHTWVHLQLRSPVFTLLRVQLEYRHPVHGTFHPLTLQSPYDGTDLSAGTGAVTYSLRWEHEQDLPGMRGEVSLRLRVLPQGLPPVTRTLSARLDPLPSFVPQQLEHGTGADPTAVRLGDFNGDGRTDLAVAHRTTSNVAVFLGVEGQGPGPLVRHQAVPAAPWFMASGDVDGDGRLDLVTGGRGDSRAFVLSGRGDGTFLPAHPVSMAEEGSGLAALELADLDGDGQQDLVALSTGRFHVARGRGDGSFESARAFPAPPKAAWLGVADFDGDGRWDLGLASTQAGGEAVFALNAGDGTFQLMTARRCGHLEAVGAGDLEGDGRAELLVSCYEDAAEGLRSIRALTVDGPEAVRSRVVAEGLKDYSTRIHVADVSGDGRPELLLTSWFSKGSGEGALEVLHGRVDGRFESRQDFILHNPSSVAVGDLNGDRVPDVAIAGEHTHASHGRVELLLGKGDGLLEKAAPLHVDRLVHDALPMDLDRDGRMDLVVAYDALSLRFGLGHGGFHPARDHVLPAAPRALAAADLDRDGQPELLVADAQGTVQAYVFEQGRLVPRQRLGQVAGAWKLMPGDFNRDGTPDVLVARRDWRGAALLLSTGSGFRAVEVADKGGSIAVGDADGDGLLDVVLSHYEFPLRLLRGDGQGGFTPTSTALPHHGVSHMGDLTGDGRPDILTSGCTLMVGRVDGTFLERAPFGYPGCTGSAVGDYDGDGRLDVMGFDSTYGYGPPLLWRVDGEGELQGLGELLSGPYTSRTWAADFNGDGVDDPVVFRHYLSESYVENELHIALSRGRDRPVSLPPEPASR